MLYRAGALTAIHIPTEQEEAARDLLRCREDIRADLLRARHRLSKFLLRHGRRFTGDEEGLVEAPRRVAARADVAAAGARPDASRRICAPSMKPSRGCAPSRRTSGRCSTSSRCARASQRLRCFRGIDDLTALTIAAELGDARRFATAPEHDGVCRPRAVGALERDETGARRDHQNRQRPSAARPRRSRLALSPPSVRRRRASARANAARRRPSSRTPGPRSSGCIVATSGSPARGKPKQHVVTAVARELTGFVWAALTQ